MSTRRGAGTQTRSVAFSRALDTISPLTDKHQFEETRDLLYRPNYREISHKRLGRLAPQAVPVSSALGRGKERKFNISNTHVLHISSSFQETHGQANYDRKIQKSRTIRCRCANARERCGRRDLADWIILMCVLGKHRPASMNRIHVNTPRVSRNPLFHRGAWGLIVEEMRREYKTKERELFLRKKMSI